MIKPTTLVLTATAIALVFLALAGCHKPMPAEESEIPALMPAFVILDLETTNLSAERTLESLQAQQVIGSHMNAVLIESCLTSGIELPESVSINATFVGEGG